VAATADVVSGAPSFGRRLIEVVLLVVIPMGLPWAWGFGVVLVARRRPEGWLTTLAISPVGLFGPLWFYTHGISHEYSPWTAFPIAAALLGGCLGAMLRILQKPAWQH
jgi:hypothetical protein